MTDLYEKVVDNGYNVRVVAYIQENDKNYTISSKSNGKYSIQSNGNLCVDIVAAYVYDTTAAAKMDIYTALICSSGDTEVKSLRTGATVNLLIYNIDWFVGDVPKYNTNLQELISSWDTGEEIDTIETRENFNSTFTPTEVFKAYSDQYFISGQCRLDVNVQFENCRAYINATYPYLMNINMFVSTGKISTHSNPTGTPAAIDWMSTSDQWVEIYRHDNDGNPKSGSLADLKAHMDMGKRIRLRFGQYSAIEADTLRWYANGPYQLTPKPEVVAYYTGSAFTSNFEELWSYSQVRKEIEIISTSGLYRKYDLAVNDNSMYAKSIESLIGDIVWFAEKRNWSSVHQTPSSDQEKASLINAVQTGNQLRLVIQETNFTRYVPADLVEINNDDENGGNNNITMYNVRDNVITFNDKHHVEMQYFTNYDDVLMKVDHNGTIFVHNCVLGNWDLRDNPTIYDPTSTEWFSSSP